jgi:hypothetical protein
MEYDGLFSDTTSDLRLSDGQTDLYGDFSKTSLAGRIAQGMAFLFMNSQGYRSGERLESFARRMLGESGLSTDWGVKIRAKVSQTTVAKRAPDFIFQNSSTQTALVESKGGFAARDSKPGIKEYLRQGLSQIDQWIPAGKRSLINPAPRKGFVIGTYLREERDPNPEPSGIVFVDPEGSEPDEDVPHYRKDLIDRANYAAWLNALGFLESASALRTYRSNDGRRERRLPCIRIGGNLFAFTIWAADLPSDDILPGWWERVDPELETYFLLQRAFRRPPRVLVCGIETRALASITRMLAPDTAREPLFVDGPILRDGIDSNHLSVFNDGTLLGEYHVDDLRSQPLEMQPFTL